MYESVWLEVCGSLSLAIPFHCRGNGNDGLKQMIAVVNRFRAGNQPNRNRNTMNEGQAQHGGWYNMNRIHTDRNAVDEWKLKASMGENEYFVNDILEKGKRYFVMQVRKF